MRRLVAALGGVACLAGCAEDTPCAFSAPGAPWLALGSAESGSWDVQVIRADGTCRRAVTQGPSSDLRPSWAPGGLLAYDSDRAPGLGIWIHEVATGAARRLDVGDLRATSPAFSPDGSTLAFEGRAASETTGAIYVVPAQGGTPALLTPEAVPHGNGGPAFSPDGATLYFVSNRAGPYDVFSVPAAGGDAVRVTTGSGIVGKPAVSPDGKTLAYARAVATSTEVVLRDLDTGAIAALPVAAASEPAFDPAGGRLAIRVFHGMSSRIELVPLDGIDPLALTDGSGIEGSPAFAPQER